jgi:glycosyltransferase involved in cell wall biosynthesis
MAVVSVIIPTRNRAQLLPRAVSSVLRQTFPDFEVIIVDDGSTDGTPELRARFHDNRIRWLRHDISRGGAAARNTGILHSGAEYIAFLDDDDEWYPEKLARQTEIIAKSTEDVAAVYTGYLVVDASTGKINGQKIPTKRGDLYRELLQHNCIGGTSCVLLKRSCLEKVGLFDELLPSFQDYDLWMRISRDFRFECIAEPLLKYFVHPKRIWTDPDVLRRGLEIMLAKYGRSATFRKYCSVLYLALGVRFCEIHRMEEGRKAFSAASALNPYRLQPYLYHCLAFCGSETFLAARATRASMKSAMRRWNF